MHSDEFSNKKLRLTILPESDRQDESHQAQQLAIDAVFGKYAPVGVSVDDLHRERQLEKLKEGHEAAGL